LTLLAPFTAVPFAATYLADEQAGQLASGLSAVASAVSMSEVRERVRDADQVALWRAQLAGLWDELAMLEQPSRKEQASEAKRRRRYSSVPAGVFVSADKVLALANWGARPNGIRVSASGPRPAGLMLVGVSGLGVGLRDGDILTHALGRPAVSESSVVGDVIRARGARQRQLSGRIWRDGRSFSLTVAQPYLEAG
jgi:hypothetical protein